MFLNKKNIFGIGLLELMLALVIIAVLLLMSVRYFEQASEAKKVADSVKIIHTLIDASFKWVEGQNDFTGFGGVSDLVNAGILSSDWNTKRDPWGGNISIIEDNNDKNKISIILDGVPIESCRAIDDIMVKQNVSPCNCFGAGYFATYPRDL